MQITPALCEPMIDESSIAAVTNVTAKKNIHSYNSNTKKKRILIIDDSISDSAANANAVSKQEILIPSSE